MRTPIIAASIFFSLAAVTGVFAKEMNGTIKKIDAATSSVTLDSGKILKIPLSMDFSALKVGEKVHVSYSTTSGSTTVKSIVPAK